jgi:hypothetical protein
MTITSAPRTLARPSPGPRTSSPHRAALYVVGLLGVLPLLAFALAAARAAGLFTIGVGFLLVSR